MRRLLCALLLVLVAVSAYGFLVVNRMRLTTIDEPREYIVVVTDANADASYHWLLVTGCTADHTDDGVRCNNGWSARSERLWVRDLITGAAIKQMPMPFRDAPRGPILRFDAVVIDRNGKAVASASMITMRRR